MPGQPENPGNPVHPVWHQFEPRAQHESLQDWLTASFRAAIVAGSLLPGARLPASRRLATELSLSRNTVAVAYERLLAEGLLETRIGAGTYVPRSLTRPAPRASAPLKPPRRFAGRVARLLPRSGDRPVADSRRPLTPGLPDPQLFPHAVWARLASRYWRSEPRLGYSDPAGLPALREAIAGFIGATRGVVCHPDQILVTAGTQGAMHAVFHALLDPGASVWVEDPGYRQVWRALHLVGAHPVPVPVDDAGLVVGRGRELAPDARLAVVSPSHQYPTGSLMSLARRLELLDWAAQSDAWIFEDDYDGEYRYDGAPIKSLKSLDRDDRVIYAGTLSKILAPGLRLGYMVVPEALCAPLRALRQAIDYGVSEPVQAVFAEFVAQGHLGTHIRKTRSIYNERRLEVVAALAAMPGLASVSGSAAGLHLLAHLNGASDAEVVRRCHDRGLGVAALSSYFYDAPHPEVPGPAQTGILIGYANAEGPVLTRALQDLATCLRHT